MTIMVGVDTSTGARLALRWASRHAEEAGSPMLAVTSWQYPRSAALPGGPELRGAEEMDASAAERLRDVLSDELGGAAADVQVRIGRGPAELVLVDVASKEHAELLVVGRRGLGALEGRLLGSVSRRVAELAPCPVAIVASEVSEDGPLVVGVDGSPAAAAARDWAVATASRSGAGIVLVHGVAGLPAELPPSAIDRFVEAAERTVAEHAVVVGRAGVAVEQVVTGVDPRLLIEQVAHERSARAVVVGTSGDGPVSGLLIGSVVNHVLQQHERPVVVVPPVS